MSKNNYMKDLNDIQNITKKIKTINESVNFGDEYDDFGYQGENEDPEGEMMPQGQEMENDVKPFDREGGNSQSDMEEEGLDQLTEVDQIREIALKGMIKLCKNPLDPQYMALKKVFQFVDKAAEDKNKEEEGQH